MSDPTNSPVFDPINRFKKSRPEVFTCTQCGGRWMELVAVQQFPKDNAYIIGQKPGSVKDDGFYMFRCVKCLEVFEPRLLTAGPQNSVQREYDEFANHMSKPLYKKDSGEEV